MEQWRNIKDIKRLLHFFLETFLFCLPPPFPLFSKADPMGKTSVHKGANDGDLFVVVLKIFSLEDNCFTVLYWSLPYINMNQPKVYICPLPLEPPSHSTPHPMVNLIVSSYSEHRTQ